LSTPIGPLQRTLAPHAPGGYHRGRRSAVGKSVSVLNQFESRRRKEQLAVLVVKFLKAFTMFRGIHDQFHAAARNGCLTGCGLFQKVLELQESLAFDMKEKAHYLFRAGGKNGGIVRDSSGEKSAKSIIGELKSAIETRSIDSYIGTGFHLLLILGESLYQLDHYTPEFKKEQAQIARIERLAKRAGYTFTAEELNELERLRALSEISMKVSAETEELAFRFMQRCDSLFIGTAEVIRHFIEGAGDNEVLIQNLLQNIGLLEQVYGQDSAERIFWALCRHKKCEGRTGLEKAMSFARQKCGNVTGLPAADKSS
jgi:hypothetical protein